MGKRVDRCHGSLTLFVLVFTASPINAGRKHKDVENIGNRSINGRIAAPRSPGLIFPNFISLEKEIQMGAQYAQMIEQTARLVEDPVVGFLLTLVRGPSGSGDREELGCEGTLCHQGDRYG